MNKNQKSEYVLNITHSNRYVCNLNVDNVVIYKEQMWNRTGGESVELTKVAFLTDYKQMW